MRRSSGYASSMILRLRARISGVISGRSGSAATISGFGIRSRQSLMMAAGVGVVTAAAPVRYLDEQLLDELLAGA